MCSLDSSCGKKKNIIFSTVSFVSHGNLGQDLDSYTLWRAKGFSWNWNNCRYMYKKNYPGTGTVRYICGRNQFFIFHLKIYPIGHGSESGGFSKNPDPVRIQ
jgi:hypothetical protein